MCGYLSFGIADVKYGKFISCLSTLVVVKIYIFFVSENVGNVTKGKNDLNPNIGSNWQYW